VRLLECVPELTHRVVLLTIYATGLRISEATRLRIQDIDSPRRLIHVREGKSRRDRVVPLPPLLLDVLRTYWKEVRPVTWLFPGQQGATCIHRQTVTRACKRAARRAGLGKRVTAHTLRHCFATQLLESGADIRTIQELLGHRHVRTTTIYTHVTPELLQITTNPLELLARETPRVLDLARVHGSKSATSSASTEPNTCKATDR
jgi:site-specific recombinase XerD